jgi:hypothetical protein
MRGVHVSLRARFIASVLAAIALGLCSGAPAGAASVDCPQALEPTVNCDVEAAEAATLAAADIGIVITTLALTFNVHVPSLDPP